MRRYEAPGEAWVCVEAPAGVSYRLKLHVPTATAPDVSVGVHNPPLSPPAPEAWPAKESARCQATSGTFLVNGEVAGKHLWLATATAGSTAELCVRQQDVASGSGSGGVVTVDGTKLPAQFGLSPDLSPCTQVVNHFDAPPVKLHLDASPVGDPQSVCVDAGVYAQRFFVGSSDDGSTVRFMPDS